jgi:hypothetical protein
MKGAGGDEDGERERDELAPGQTREAHSDVPQSCDRQSPDWLPTVVLKSPIRRLVGECTPLLRFSESAHEYQSTRQEAARDSSYQCSAPDSVAKTSCRHQTTKYHETAHDTGDNGRFHSATSNTWRHSSS